MSADKQLHDGNQESIINTEVYESSSDSEEIMTEALSTDTECDSNEITNEPGKEYISVQELTVAGRFLVGLAQIVVAIATVYYAWLVYETLIEMQTERDNAYHPDMVVTSGMFEGSLVKEDETEIDEKKYMYIDYDSPNPAYCYEAYPKLYNILTGTYLYLERPYLTLKNIGQGTAKDIRVTFSTDWLKKAIFQLNDNSLGYKYGTHGGASRDFNERAFAEKNVNDFEGKTVYCTVDGEDYHVMVAPEEKKNIQYIECDGSVKILLPQYICNIYALYFYQNFKENSSLNKDLHTISANFALPDLEISIEYYDMQGKEIDNQTGDGKLVIPWTANYEMRRSESDYSKFKPINMKTYFYEDFIN